jgi:hypothetical protein
VKAGASVEGGRGGIVEQLRNTHLGRYAVVFCAVAVAGLAGWVLGTPVVAGWLLGEAAYERAYSFPPFILGGLPLAVVVAAVAGYLLPKAFWLRGFAAVSLHPVAEASLVAVQVDRGVVKTSELGGLVFVLAVILRTKAGAATLGSLVGAGLRMLWRYSRKRGGSAR